MYRTPPRTRRVRVALSAIPLVLMAPSAVHAVDGDIDTAMDTLGIQLNDQVRSRIDAVLGDSLANIDDDLDPDAQVRLNTAVRRWELAATDWRQLPVSLMEHVRMCRDARIYDGDDDAVDGCGEELQLELRLRQMQQARNHFEERLIAAGNDETALGDLDRLQQRLNDRLREFEQAEAVNRNAALGNAGFLDGMFQMLRDRLREQSEQMTSRMSQMGSGSMGGQS